LQISQKAEESKTIATAMAKKMRRRAIRPASPT
jgi:hypothetical protein